MEMSVKRLINKQSTPNAFFLVVVQLGIIVAADNIIQGKFLNVLCYRNRIYNLQ